MCSCVYWCVHVEVPSAPFDVRLVSCSARVVQLEWKHVSSDVSNDNVTAPAALQFIIEYNTSFQPDTWQVSHVTHLAGVSHSLISVAVAHMRCGGIVRKQLIYDAILGGGGGGRGGVMTNSSHVRNSTVQTRRQYNHSL